MLDTGHSLFVDLRFFSSISEVRFGLYSHVGPRDFLTQSVEFTIRSAVLQSVVGS